MDHRTRWDAPGSRHHVFNRGANRVSVFPARWTRELFIDLVRTHQSEHGIRIHAYALLTNHFHLLLTSDDRELGRFMQRVTGEWARKLNRWHPREAQLCRARYAAVPVRTTAHWMHLPAYIHLNDRRLRKAPRVTSHYAYCAPNEGWVDTAEHLAIFGGPAGYRRYLRHCVPTSTPPAQAVVDVASAWLGYVRTLATQIAGESDSTIVTAWWLRDLGLTVRQIATQLETSRGTAHRLMRHPRPQAALDELSRQLPATVRARLAMEEAGTSGHECLA